MDKLVNLLCEEGIDTGFDQIAWYNNPAYEYLIGQFAAGSGKKAGEFYTPQQISNVLFGLSRWTAKTLALDRKNIWLAYLILPVAPVRCC